MINNNLLLEIKKIHNLMDVNHNGLILENVAATKMFRLVKDLVSKFGDDIIKLTTKIPKKDKSVFDSIINKLKLNTPLVDNEIQFLTRFVDWDKIAIKAMTDNKFIGQSFINGLNKAVNNIKKDPSSYKNELKYWTKFLETSLFDGVPDVVKNSLRNQIKERFKKAAGIVDDVTPGRIVNDVTTRLLKRRVKQYIVTKLIPRNLVILKRVVGRIATNQEKLNDEFLEITKQAAEELSKGRTAKYHFNKMSDILLSKKKSWDDGIEEMYKILKKDKNIPKDVNKAFTESEFYKTLIENTTKKDENIFKELLSPWAKLIWPWGNKGGFLEWFERLIMFIVNLNASTVNEVALNIQKSGITGYLAKRIIAGYITKFVIIPTIFAGFKAFVIGGLLEPIKIQTKGKIGNPFGPKGKETFVDSFLRQFKNGFGGVNFSVYSYIPFGSLIDDIVDLWQIKNENTFDRRNYSDENTKAYDEFENTTNNIVNNELKFTNDISGLVKWLTDVKKLKLADADLPHIKSVGDNTYTYEDAEGKIYTYEYSGNTFQ